MPISARMSLWGLYQYDNTILDNLTLPTGMDADNLKQNLLVETAGLSILYPDPDFLKTVIGLWSAERQDVWQKLYNTTVLQYDPIQNYDRTEETEEVNDGVSVRSNEQKRDATSDGVTTRDSDQTRSRSESGNTSDVNTSSGTSETVNSNTAYNSNTFTDTAKAESSGSNSSSTSGSSSSSSSENVAENGNESMASRASENVNESGNESRSDRRHFKSRVFGNIGVTTSQQMIMSEREVAEFCMTEYVINDFIQRFCVMVY